MITEIETYFVDGCGRCKRFATPECSARLWHDGLGQLREICLSEGLDETVKWGQPCYTREGRNIVLFGAFRDDFRLTFFNGSLLKDPERILQKRGPNTQQADIIRFTSAEQVRALAPTLRAYIREAVGYAKAGITPTKTTTEVILPDELIDALDADPDFSDAFHALTPGRQRSYVIALNSAKKPETRRARIAKFRDKVIAGKGATER